MKHEEEWETIVRKVREEEAYEKQRNEMEKKTNLFMMRYLLREAKEIVRWNTGNTPADNWLERSKQFISDVEAVLK